MKKDLELYLHIPFCVKKCAYCDFLSAPGSETDEKEYADALIEEIKGYQGAFRENYKVKTIFIGGGTPSILRGSRMQEIFHALHESFQIVEEAEVTIEVNPGTVTVEKLKAWKHAGINRLSIGLQSADNEELAMLGRIHTYQEFLDTYSQARAQGFANINIDLISAIPGQTVMSWEHTLTKAARLNPEHISAYSLIIEEGTPFYDRYGKSNPGKQYPNLPDEDTERAIYEMTAQILSGYGYQRYEISNYAKEGYACMHNIGYWERTDYLGIGLGASSLISHTRYHHTSDLKTYITNIHEKKEIREDIEELSLSDEIEEFMFLGLRKTRGISIKQFESTFGLKLFNIYGEQINKLTENNLIEKEGDSLFLTKRGIDVSNTVFVEFLEPKV